MGRLITFMDFCNMRNMPMGFAGLDRNAKISNKLLKTNVPGGVLQLTKDAEPKIEQRFLETDIPGAPVTLDENGKIRRESLPEATEAQFKGEFVSVGALVAAYPHANLADYAYVEHEGYYWWNSKIIVNGVLSPRWVKQLISETEYQQLNEDAKLAVHYIINSL